MKENIELLNKTIKILESATLDFCKHLSPIRQEEVGSFILLEPNKKEYLILHCLRVVNDLNACMLLIKQGYFQQIGMICRGILEFSHNMDYVFEELKNKDHKKNVNKLIQEYFSEQLISTEEQLKKVKKNPSLPRRNIYASIGRLIDETNPFRTFQIVKSLEEVYSKYTHGSYRVLMELYDGKKFRTRGMESRRTEWTLNIALIIHPLLNQFSLIATGLKLKSTEERLRKEREFLEQTPMYNQSI